MSTQDLLVLSDVVKVKSLSRVRVSATPWTVANINKNYFKFLHLLPLKYMLTLYIFSSSIFAFNLLTCYMFLCLYPPH